MKETCVQNTEPYKPNGMCKISEYLGPRVKAGRGWVRAFIFIYIIDNNRLVTCIMIGTRMGQKCFTSLDNGMNLVQKWLSRFSL